ncbi:hypothetical protein ABZ747_26405 [Kitasatospora cineracea]|uniref:hypothetical protein n=1 Tax=Kitasatospora cineracea TaxID=88074 RepID=UPI0033F36EB9
MPVRRVRVCPTPAPEARAAGCGLRAAGCGLRAAGPHHRARAPRQHLRGASTGGPTYWPAAELAYTADLDDAQLRLRAFVELHRPDTGTEPIAGQLAASARLWEQAGPDGAGRAWERLWKTFPQLLVVLTGITAAEARTAMADLRPAAEERPGLAEMLTAAPAGAARLEDLLQHGPAAPVRHSLAGQERRPYGWTEL